MRTQFLLPLCVLGLTASVAAAGTYPSINVTDAPYSAIANDGVNDTVAFQNALNAAGATRGHVVVPPGVFDFTGTLTIPSHVTLEGQLDNPNDWHYCPDGPGMCPPNPWRSTTLRVHQSAATLATPFIQMQVDASVLGVAIYHKDQTRTMSPVVYPAAIRGSASCSVEDVLLVNPYYGLDFASNPSDRHVIRNVYGWPIHLGISVDKCVEPGRIEHIHFWPFTDPWDYPSAGTTDEYIARYAVAAQFLGSDGEIVNDFFAFGYHVGIQFANGSSGTTSGEFSNINLDAADVGIDIYAADAADGLHFSNLNIAPGSASFFLNKKAIWSHPGGNAWLEIDGASFWGPWATGNILWESGHLTLTNTLFHDWGGAGAAITLAAGTGSIQGNYFRPGGGNGQAVAVNASAGNVVVNDNQLNTNLLVNNNGGQTLMLGNQP